ncbi:hypothetical protein L1049_000629 [Liquidambar formosana]|uniref:Phosphoacetylglucosamine mutase n=1 Tax=Liquidambar formosana TaxID=63359 RepID=A0AAP0ND40_LIQFO
MLKLDNESLPIEHITKGIMFLDHVLCRRVVYPTLRYTATGGKIISEKGICSILGSVSLDMGILTTPQLHWMVRARNKDIKSSELDYFEQLSSSFRCLMDLIPKERKISGVGDKFTVDGANGVGGEKLEVLKKMLNALLIEVRNSGKEGGVLNEGVGADYVQKEKVVPCGFGPNDVGIRCASLDGDADRLMAYANGASTDYLKQLGLEVVFTPTGVKYLHEKAAEYDIGIYFEANGHGTILFSERFLYWVEARNDELSSLAKGSEQQKAASRLLAVSKLINQAVGDALSGLLLVEAILCHMGWSIHRWSELYQDLPSPVGSLRSVKVVDRTAVVTTNAETLVVQPPGIQEAINAETVIPTGFLNKIMLPTNNAYCEFHPMYA